VMYSCCDERRLEAVRQAGVLNGIEFLEVSDTEAPTEALRQRTLFVHLLRPPPTGADALGPQNVSITGGERIPDVGVEWVAPADDLPAGESADLVAELDDPSTVLLVRTDVRGDHSTYTFRLVASPTDTGPPTGFDPRLIEVDFSFKVECPSDFDCREEEICPPEEIDLPTIDYLAKDYDTFRRLMLDRLALVAPGWDERTPAELGIALVEVLAYVADELSYRQDAVATEAYLATARRRPSIRRLARLVDYAVHDGSNARAWARLTVDADNVALPDDLRFLTRVGGLDDVIEPDSPEWSEALAARAEVFEPVAADEPQVLHESLSTLSIHTWGDTGCCLPAGATALTIRDHHATRLHPGDVVVLAEVAGAGTGTADDADPSHRWPVRLTSVTDSSDPSGGLFDDPPSATAVDVTELEWHPDDALPFPLCVSDRRQPGVALAEVWGNIVLVDHGRTVTEPEFAVVPDSVLTYATVGGGGSAERCDPRPDEPVPVRFRPTLAGVPLTSARPSPSAAGEPAALPSARATTSTDPRRARPAVRLHSTLGTVGQDWDPLPDLLATQPDDTNFVVEAEHDGTVRLRFGDDAHGRRPAAGSVFDATYRIGNGVAGNVGAGAIAHVVTPAPASVTGVTNPIPAVGGIDPESADVVRRDAPEAFLVQERAVTEADYAEVAERFPVVQRAAATFRWTGSWNTVFLTADRLGGGPVDAVFEDDLRDHVERFRMAGYDLEVDAPEFVPLEIELHLCVAREHFRSQVRGAVADVLSSGVRADGRRGYFHPDNFTFAQPVYLSPIVAAAQSVTGVTSVEVATFQRQRDDASSAIATGVLEMGRLEVARLDNDPNFPERGALVLTTGGGK